MALAIELVIIPVAIVIGIILMSIADAFSTEGVAIGFVLLATIVGVVYGLVRFARALDLESSVDHAPDQAASETSLRAIPVKSFNPSPEQALADGEPMTDGKPLSAGETPASAPTDPRSVP